MNMEEMVSALPTKIRRLHFGLIALGYLNFQSDTEQSIPATLNSWMNNAASSLTTKPVIETARKFTWSNIDTDILYQEKTNRVTKKILGVIVPFTKEELKLLDSLGIELGFSYIGKQNIDDWWNMK